MGGRRCAFKNCPVSTSRNPGIHFFRFPKKGLTDWIAYTGMENYLKLPEYQQRNKVICGRHFKDACFMNYKQDRLIPTAVPTISRLSTEWALDYEKDIQMPQLVKLEKPKQSHLIAPPEFRDPQAFNEEDLRLAEEIMKDFHNISDLFEPKTKRPKVGEHINTASDTEVELLELINEEDASNLSNDTKEMEQLAYQDDSVLSEEEIMKNHVQELEKLLTEKINENDAIMTKLKDCEQRNTNANKERSSLLVRLKQCQLQTQSESKANQQLKVQLGDITAKYEEIMRENIELKEQVENMQADFAKNEIVSSTKDESPVAAVQSHQLSKLQLFNSIKRYLSPTMTALLRLQLAAISSERCWKPDEKRVAIDLIGLGQDVYKYFTDEWLLRLPDIQCALEWRNQTELQDDEDEL